MSGACCPACPVGLPPAVGRNLHRHRASLTARGDADPSSQCADVRTTPGRVWGPGIATAVLKDGAALAPRGLPSTTPAVQLPTDMQTARLQFPAILSKGNVRGGLPWGASHLALSRRTHHSSLRLPGGTRLRGWLLGRLGGRRRRLLGRLLRVLLWGLGQLGAWRRL